MGEMRRAAMLLLTLEPWLQAEAIVPGKVFEYLAAGRPILASIPHDHLATRTILHAEAGLVSDRKEGRWSYYRINAEALEEVHDLVRHLGTEASAPKRALKVFGPCCG